MSCPAIRQRDEKARNAFAAGPGVKMRSITEARNTPAAGRDSNGGKNMPLREGIFEYETEIDLFENKSDTQCAVVTGSTQERRFMEVPETLGGLPVRKIAPHALSEKKDLRMISLPRSLR